MYVCCLSYPRPPNEEKKKASRPGLQWRAGARGEWNNAALKGNGINQHPRDRQIKKKVDRAAASTARYTRVPWCMSMAVHGSHDSHTIRRWSSSSSILLVLSRAPHGACYCAMPTPPACLSSRSRSFRQWYSVRLVRAPALRIQSGMGGVIFLSSTSSGTSGDNRSPLGLGDFLWKLS